MIFIDVSKFFTRERFYFFLSMNPGNGSSIFLRIRQEAGLKALSFARRLEKSTYKLEAHHRHLHFTHRALENQFIPKSLRFKPPGAHPIFKRIMKKSSNVAKHAWTFNHDIDFNNSKIIDKANNRSRKTLESWHTAKTVGADNNSCPLPRQYHILLKKH